MKKCAKCCEIKEDTEFHKQPKNKSGLHSYCKVCRKEAKKIEYIQNKDKYNARSKRYSEQNHDRMLKYWHDFHEPRKLQNGYVTGTLNPTTNTAIGVIGEYIAENVLKDCINYNKTEFHAKYDLYNEKYKNINVKMATKAYYYNCNTTHWRFVHKYVSLMPDTFICIGLSLAKSTIEHVWIIPSTSNKVTKHGIAIPERRIPSFREYEVDATPYNTIYKNLNIYELPEFRNLK